MKLSAGICLLFIVITGNLCAQNFWQDYPYVNSGVKKNGSGTHSFIVTEGMFAYGCDGVNNEFLNKMYRGGFMDSAFIEKSSDDLLPSNRFGVSTSVGLSWTHTFNDTTREQLSIGAYRRTNITGRFSDDAFRLGFQGNTRFKGEEADFSRTRLTAMTWSQLRIGYITPHPNGTVSFSFSLLGGHQYNQADIEYGKLYTDSQGLNLTGSVYGDYWSSDTANTSTYAINGLGTSVDITWLWYKDLKSGNRRAVKVDFLDFGFINWNNKTIHRYADTTFTWQGVDISQLFIDPDFVAELPEENDFVKSDTTEFHRSIFLPAVIRGTYMQTFFNSKVIGKFSFAMPFWSEALPYGALTATWRSTKFNYAITAGAAYGGYARLQVPLKAELYMVKFFTLEAGTTNALAFIDPATVAGSGAYIKLVYTY